MRQIYNVKINFPERNVFLVSIGFFWIFFGFGAAQQYLLPLLKLQNMESIGLTSLLLIYVFFLISGIFSPKFVPKIGLKKSIIIGSATYWIFTSSISTSSSVFIFIASALLGTGAGLFWISSGQIIANDSTKKNMGKNFGIQHSAFSLGNLAGIGFGAYFLNTLSIGQLYLYLTLAMILSFPFFFLIKIGKEITREKTFKPLMLLDKKLLLMFPVIFSGYFLMGQTFSAMNLIILGLFGISFVGILSTLFRFINVLGGVTIGKISDMLSKTKLLYLLATIGLMGTALFAGTSQLVLIILGIVFLGILISSVYPVSLSLYKETVSETEYKYALGAFHVYSTLGVLASCRQSLFQSCE